MRKITTLECELLASFIKFPSLYYCFSDLTKNHFNTFGWIVYSAYADFEILDGLSEYQIFTELRKKDLISSEEFDFCNDDYGIPYPAITSYSAENAYKQLKSNWALISIKDRLANIVSSDKTPDEIREELRHINTNEVDNEEHFVSLQSIEDEKDDGCKVRFGVDKLDQNTKIGKQDLIFLGARPSNGKTTLAIKFAMENSKHGKVLFYSMEMGDKRIKWKCRSYGNAYKTENVLFRFASSVSIQEIRRSIFKHSPVLVVIDQLNKIETKSDKEYDQFTKAARGLKILAVDTNTPILCLAQMNRDSEKTKGRPYLHNFKSSGSIEEEADVCILIDVPDYSECITKLYLEKNRTKKGYFTETSLKLNLETDQYSEV